jgi:hypothetical protein
LPVYLRRGGGYSFNVGCSDMIIDGLTNLLQYDAIDRFVPEGVVPKDGTTRPLDLAVVATGYESQQEFVRSTLGSSPRRRSIRSSLCSCPRQSSRYGYAHLRQSAK